LNRIFYEHESLDYSQQASYFLVRKSIELVKDSFYDSIPNVSEKNIKFLSYNRRWYRQHRLKFLLFCQKNNLFEENLISYNFDFDTNEMPGIRDSLTQKETVIFDKLLKIPKRILDYEDFNTLEGFQYETPEHYQKTFFSIVTETNFYNNKKITEKTFKPLCHYHMFIVLGSPKTLEYLKGVGLKTFNKFWDESYDGETDSDKRMNKVFNLVLYFNSLSKSDLSQLYLDCKDILIHNYNLMLKYGKRGERYLPDEQQ
jgi:hypothetical protein